MTNKKLTPAEALDLEFDHDEIGGTTIRGYFIELLTNLWRQGEGFSGKRPFGDSGWEHDLEVPLVKSGCVNGTIKNEGDEDEPYWYVEDLDRKAYDKFVFAMIDAL